MSTVTPTLSTQRTYYQDSYLFQLEAKILDLGQDEQGSYLICDRTLFHPQGGGQPDDKGQIHIGSTQLTVMKLAAPRDPNEVPYVIKHYYTSSSTDLACLKTGAALTQTLDRETRTLYARYHSAGHLLSHAVNQLYPQLDGCRGNHFPGQAFVLFSGSPIPELQSLKAQLAKKVEELVRAELPMCTSWQSQTRVVQFGELKGYPCGGTHVKNSREVGQITIRNLKIDKQQLRIGYDIV